MCFLMSFGLRKKSAQIAIISDFGGQWLQGRDFWEESAGEAVCQEEKEEGLCCWSSKILLESIQLWIWHAAPKVEADLYGLPPLLPTSDFLFVSLGSKGLSR